MTEQSIIDLIIKDKRYLSICKDIVKNKPHLADDLYQETMLFILECSDNRINLAHQENRLEIFIYGIMYNKWAKRNRIKSYEKGETSVFLEYCDTYETHKNIFENNDIWQLNDYNFDNDYLENKMIDIIKKDCDSQEMCIRYRARVFNLSNDDVAKIDKVDACKNPRQFAESSKIPYSAVWKVCNEYKKSLKERLQ